MAGQEGSKTWREDFVLADEDFPGLPGSKPQSRTVTPTKDKPEGQPVKSWRPEGKLPGMGIVQAPKASSEPVR